jgi:hypothetical protein
MDEDDAVALALLEVGGRDEEADVEADGRQDAGQRRNQGTSLPARG